MSAVKICLNMIVKDESGVICRCMDSVKHLLDAVAISDTGSSDDTVDVIEKWIDKNGMKGGVDRKVWHNFGENRNFALKYAESVIESVKVDGDIWFILFMDADDIVLGRDNRGLIPLNKDSLDPNVRLYYIDMKCGTLTYDRTWMILYDAEFKWSWKQVLHEYISPEDGCKLKPNETGKIKDGYILATRDGARSKDPMKYMKDAVTLERYIYECKDSDKKPDPRDQFYLAQSYRDSGLPHLLKVAEKLYLKRTEMGGWPEEIYISYLEAGKCRERRGKTDYVALDYYFKAYELRPHRLEAPHNIVRWFRGKKLFRAGYTFGMPLINQEYPKGDRLFVDDSIHKWRFLDEVAICGYYSGDKKKCKELCEKILNNDLSDANKKRILKNLSFCEK